MKRTFQFITIAAVFMLLGNGCAKEQETSESVATIRYFEAWIATHHPGLQKTGKGIYIIDETEGTGETIESFDYAFLKYTVTDLKGNITQTNDEEVAKQLGTYKPANYYNSSLHTPGTIYAGVEEIIKGMKIGGRRTAVIPTWLMVYPRLDTEEDYIRAYNQSAGANSIYTIELLDTSKHIYKTQIKQIEKYLEDRFIGEKVDSICYGMYYKQRVAPAEDVKDFPEDTTIYINYTGRLLNGQVFDTTIKDTAKKYNIYNASKKYAPASVKWAADSTGITLNSGEIIPGFSNTIWQMKAFESGTGVFYSPLGYGITGSGSLIPGYAPLVFDIEIIEKEED